MELNSVCMFCHEEVDLRIILIIPTMQQGGAERVMSELANNWADKGHDVNLVLLTDAPFFYEINKKVNIHQLGFSSNKRVSNLLSVFEMFFKLRLIIKDLKPNFILSFMTKYNIFSIFASLGLNVKIFVSDRASLLTKRTLIERALKRVAYRQATGILAQTEFAKSILLNTIGHKNIRVIYNPIKNIKALEFEKEDLIITVGRLVPEKGHKYLLESFSKIENKTWKLIILGDGPLLDELKSYAELCGVKDRVSFLGAVGNVDEWLVRSSVFAFTSLSEGFPNALAEAMAAGLPCVSFDCISGPSDLIEHGKNGFLVPLKDVEMFSCQLNKLIDDKNLISEIGRNARLTAEKLDVNIIANQTINFFCESQRS